MKQQIDQPQSVINKAVSASLAMLPLAISVIPWGILCGTLSIEAGLSNVQAQLMSLLVFAGAAQLSGIAILGSGGSLGALINSTAMISVRHVLYSASYKEDIKPLTWFKRILFAFLLTDEMFAVAQAQQIKTGKFDYWFAVIAGFVFYVVWNIATFIGIFSAHILTNIDELGFDFAIAATFIAMVIPMIKTKAILIAITISAITVLCFDIMNIKHGLIISGVMGMMVGALFNRHNKADL